MPNPSRSVSPKSSTTDKTDYRFKILYAIGMIMVVAGHYTEGGGINILANWFPYYGFHLGLFLFASGYFYKEKENWERYHDAVLAVAMLEDHGSSGTLNIIGALNQSLDLWSASFHNLLLHKQSQDVSFPHTKFTSRMIEDAYKAFFDEASDNWYNPYTDDSKEGLEEYQATASNERKMWNEWMKYRTIVAKALPKELREVYNGCTNLMMRAKLHQLKNQNAGLGLMSDDVSDCLLPDSCSDNALLEYPGLNVVLKKHSEDLNWYPVFE